MTQRLLIVGASGQLGRRVAAKAVSMGWYVAGTFHTAPVLHPKVAQYRLDIRDRAQVEHVVAEIGPDAIVNAAMRQAGSDSWAINADGAAIVAAASAKVGARLVHLSSDAIFDGHGAPYTEQSHPSPITQYGASKAAAETAVRIVAPEAVLVRTSLIIDDDPIDKHSRLVMDIVAGHSPVALFTDELRCPILAADLAAAVLELVDLPISGPLNVAGADPLSRYELGLLVPRRYGLDPDRVRSASLAETGLHRPPDARLDIRRAQAVLKMRLRGAREFLDPART